MAKSPPPGGGKPSNIHTQTLYRGDNIDFLRAINSECVDLIAVDPPFNKGKDFHATPDSLADGGSFQDRWSWERDVEQAWVDQIEDDHPALMEAIESAKHASGEDMGAFMCFMSVRLLAMHRIIKPTGSLMLHCDATASHYLKGVLDAIFGKDNFRNEIVWCYKENETATRWLPRKHDIIFWYSKSEDYTFNMQRGEFTQAQLKRYNHVKEDGTRWANMKGKMRQLQGGARLRSWWADIPICQSNERSGYPTQKPVLLYERLVSMTTNKGDMVLDCFAGGGTTCVAAARLGRAWVAIDLWEKTARFIQDRMKEECPEMLDGLIKFTDVPPERTDDGRTAAPYLKPKTIIQPDKGPKMSRAQMIAQLLEMHGPICQGCGRRFEDHEYLELDHMLPRSDGGANSIDNRTLLCSVCNKLKRNTLTMSGLRVEIRRIARDPKHPRHNWARNSPLVSGKPSK